MDSNEFRHSKQVYFPAVLVAFFICFLLGVIFLMQRIAQVDFFFLEKVYFGFDYMCFLDATHKLLEGSSPYEIERYVFPPLFTLLNVPLTYLDFSTACYLLFALTILAVFSSYVLIQKIFHNTLKKDDRYIMIGAGFITILLSYPFIFLVDRINIDGFVLFFVCMGLFFSSRKTIVSALFFALAISFKLYPVLLICPMILFRKWKLAFITLLFFLGFCLITPDFSLEWVTSRIFHRSSSFRVDENGSIYNTAYNILFFLQYFLYTLGFKIRMDPFFTVLGPILFFAFFLTMIYADLKNFKNGEDKQFVLKMMMYFPFMVALPKIAYHYELLHLTMLIPAICFLWRQENNRNQVRCIFLIMFGIVLSQFHAHALARIVGTQMPHAIPGFGLLFVMAGCTFYKFFTVPQSHPTK